MIGDNFIELQGYVRRPALSETNNGYTCFKGEVAVPFTYKDKASGVEKEGFNRFNVIAWGPIAQSLGELQEETPVRVQGLLQTRSYDGSCKKCGSQEKKYWTEVKVDNIEVLS